MPDYSKGKIYKICSDDPDITEVYIGSTIATLNERWSGHKADFTAGNFVSSALLFGKYGIESFKIELIEDYPCKCEKDLVIREQYYIDTVECVNVSRSYRTEEQKIAYYKQYEIDNKDNLTEYRRGYYQQNKDALSSKQKVYQTENREAIKSQKKVLQHLIQKKNRLMIKTAGKLGGYVIAELK